MGKRRLVALGIALGAATLGCGGRNGAGPAAGAAGNAADGGAGTAGARADGAGVGAAGAAGGPGNVGGTDGTGGAGTGGAAGGIGGAPGAAGGRTTGGAGAGGGSAGTGGAVPFYPLGMNDVTILAPLPSSNATPVLLRGTDLADDGTAFVPRPLFDRLTGPVRDLFSSPILAGSTYERIHLVAVRFDLCDRPLPGACPETDDARLRLVFQPLEANGGAQDVGFHAFYVIRREEIAGAIAALRELAMLAPPQPDALRVSPALSAANPEAYAERVRAFVKRYGGDGRLMRLTVNAQPEIAAQIRWVLRGVEKKGNAFVDMPIVGASATDVAESVILGGAVSYDVQPIADTPSGLLGALQQTMFDAASATKQRDYLAALAAVENPMTHTAETVACVACHVATAVTRARATGASIDPLTLPERYTSKFDLSTSAGKSATIPRTIRALGFLFRDPMISQRVVNDTAQTLAEIEARFPPP